jgi:hypothetical protein
VPNRPVATPAAREKARKVTMARADERALALAAIIAEIEASGITTPYAIAADLTRRGFPPRAGIDFGTRRLCAKCSTGWTGSGLRAFWRRGTDSVPHMHLNRRFQ